MTEDHNYGLSVHERQFMNLTVNKDCDFNKYDPYVEKIRTLFVPSLEPRIYSCLETFVYPGDQKAISKPPYLKRCLDVTGNWREPINVLSTKLLDCELQDNMLAQTVKHLIKDGLIDCFLNSIILNNRLNKVCRNLDAVGVEKNFLRYLAVWNYINEKNYWLEDDGKISMSMSEMSDYSMESHSDLNVQVGSTIDARQTTRCFNKVVRRRISDHSSRNFGRNGDITENCNKGNSASQQFLSCVSFDSNKSQGLLSSYVKRKPRSIRQTFPCRPSNCPTYRTKISQPGDWGGKTLKLRISKISSSIIDNRLEKLIRLSKLPLPCQFNDIFAEIVKADNFVTKSLSTATRKKFQPGVTNICCWINETLEKMNREEVRKCRFHCEIHTGFVTFKLLRREPNGCKSCLFIYKVAIDKSNDQNSPRTSLVSQTAHDTNQKNSPEFENLIFKSKRVDLADERLQVVSTLQAESKTQLEPQVTSANRLPKNNFHATDKQKSNEYIGDESLNDLSENNANYQTCGCKPSYVDELQYLLYKEKGNPETSRTEDTEVPANQNISRDPLKEALLGSCGNTINGQTCDCNNSNDNKFEVFNNASKVNQDISCVDRIKVPNTTNRGLELTPKDSLRRLRENEVADPTCHCTILFSKTTDINHDSEINQDHHSNKCIDKIAKDFEVSNLENVHSSTVVANKNTDSMVSIVEKDQQVMMPHLDLRSPSYEAKTRKRVEQITPRGNIGCECPSDTCACINNLNDEDESEECDSQCCDSCGTSDKSKPVACLSDVSALANPEQPLQIDSPISNPVKTVLIEKRRYPDNASNTKLQPNCVESQGNSWESHNPKMHQAKSTKSKISFISSITNIPTVDTEMKEIGTCNSLKSIQIQTNKPTKTTISKDKLSSQKSPRSSIRIDTGRLSSVKSHRINISIELRSESETSEEKLIKHKAKMILPSCQNDFIRFRRIQDFPSMSKLRSHSVGARTSRKQATTMSEKNTKAVRLRHPERINTCLHSPPQLLNSRDYLLPFESPLGMRNPIMYGMSTKSSVHSTCIFEQQSMRKHKRTKNKDSKYPKSNRVERRCNLTEETIHIDKDDESPMPLPRTNIKSDRISPSVINNNLCHAFSSSSVDRMKHLIKTKLRRILLERDKSTNTTNTGFSNDKYRVRVPNGKTRRLPFAKPRCHTIWESRSASDSAHTSKTFGSNDKTSFTGISQGDGIKTLFHSTGNCVTSKHKNLDRVCDFDEANNTICCCLRNSDESLISSSITIDRRLVGGSDASSQKTINREFQYPFKAHEKSVEKIVNKKIEYISNHCNERLSLKIANLSCPEDSKAVGDATLKLSGSVNCADCNEEGNFNGLQDEIIKYPGKLDWSGTSTSRHIYLYEYNNFESSNDEEEKKLLNRKMCSPNIDPLPTSKRSYIEKKDSKKSQKSQVNNCKEIKSRSHKSQFNRESRMNQNNRASSFRPSKMHATSSIKCQKGLDKLDQDLRSKLLQYVNLCKNVKYSLLKMLRPNDIYEVSRTSISCSNRYKLGDS